jgi:hypothetical protein
MARCSAVGDHARVVLALIRIANGALGLVVPAFLIKQLGSKPDGDPVAHYAFRLFGVRTIIIGGELLLPDGELRNKALKIAPVIHGSDVAAALISGVTGQVPWDKARRVALLSTLNTALALAARKMNR